ncbi:hypothetical protein JRQ81_009723 [Phrynocephalus forsythii]|uniref:Major facilitator superfamily (MFS) profile domain-containing protein n=1 Tax=Phrynocephalus forsythii TaxID=171643 RepID=A0A9Q0XAQ7_9SAUR|nr:hypothetical protein JRQ81_009723 [Phrynocephalus forsythii]
MVSSSLLENFAFSTATQVLLQEPSGSLFLLIGSCDAINLPRQPLSEEISHVWFWIHPGEGMDAAGSVARPKAKKPITLDFPNSTFKAVEGRTDELKFEDQLLAITTIMFPIGALSGVLVLGFFMDNLGRKSLLFLSNSINVASASLLGLSQSWDSYKIGILARFINGMSSGTFSCVVPLYIAEIAPPHLRGALHVVSTLFLTLGVLAAQLLGLYEVFGNEESLRLCRENLHIPGNQQHRHPFHAHRGEQRTPPGDLTGDVVHRFRGTPVPASCQFDDLRHDLYFPGCLLRASAPIPYLITEELFLQSARGSACVIGGFINWCSRFLTGVMFTQLEAMKSFYNETYRMRNGINIDSGLLMYQWGLTVSFFPLGGIFGSLLVGPLADGCGRKGALLANNVLAIASAVLMGCSKAIRSHEFIIFARLIVGVCTDSVANVLISELFLQSSRSSAFVVTGCIHWVCRFLVAVAYLHVELTKPLVMVAVITSFGSSLQYGYNIWVVTHPATLIQDFYNSTYTEKKKISINKAFLNFLYNLTTALFSLGGLIGSLLASLLVDRFGRRGALILNNILSIVSALLMGFTPLIFAYEYTIFTRLLTGICSERVYATMWLSEHDAQYISMISTISLIITLLIVAYLIDSVGRRVLILIGFGVCSILCVLLTMTLELQSTMSWMSYVSSGLMFAFLIGHVIGPGPMPNILIAELFLQSSRSTGFALGGFVHWLLNFLTGMVFLQIEMYIVDLKGRKILLLISFGVSSVLCVVLTITIELQKNTWVAILNSFLINVFLTGHAAGPSSLTFLLIAELFLQSSRSSAYVVGGFVHWVLHLFTVITYMELQPYLRAYSFLVCFLICVATFVYIYTRVPETRGLTFVEIRRTMSAMGPRGRTFAVTPA